MEYGVYLSEIKPDGPAQQAKLQRGDVLKGIAGEPFNDEYPLIKQLFQFKPGDAGIFHGRRNRCGDHFRRRTLTKYLPSTF